MNSMMKPAPAFDPSKARSDYPLSGEKTGPAWRVAWRILHTQAMQDTGSGRYLDAVEIVEEVSRETNVNPGTIRNLLIAAEKAGILERVVRLSGGRNRAHYRITKAHR
jgi:hypothetical protein